MKKLLRFAFLAVAFLIPAHYALAQFDVNPDSATVALPTTPANLSSPTNSSASGISTGSTDQACSNPAIIESLDNVQNGLFGDMVARVIGGSGGNSTSSKFMSAATGLSANAMPIAKALGGILAVISILYAAVLAVIEREPIGGAIFEVLIKAAVVGAVLANYSTLVIGGLTELQSGFTSISGSADAGNILTTFLSRTLTSLITPFKIAFAAISCSGFLSIKVVMLLEAVVAFLIMLLGLGLLLIGLLEALFGLLAGPMILAVAVVVGPISIACSLNGITSRAFGKWLSFAISGAIMTGIAGIVLRLFSESLNVMGNSPGDLISSSLVNVINILLAGKFFSHIPDYAAALSPDGGSGFKVGNGGGANAIGKGVNAASGTAKAGGAAAAAGARGAAVNGMAAAIPGTGAAKSAAITAQGAIGGAGRSLYSSATSGFKKAIGVK